MSRREWRRPDSIDSTEPGGGSSNQINALPMFKCAFVCLEAALFILLLMVRNGRGGDFRAVSGNYIAPKLAANNLLVDETATIKFLSPFASCESGFESKFEFEQESQSQFSKETRKGLFHIY